MVKLNNRSETNYKISLRRSIWCRSDTNRLFKQSKDKLVLLSGTEFRIDFDYVTSHFGDYNENFFNFHIEIYTTSSRTFFVLNVCGIEMLLKTKDELVIKLESFFNHMDMMDEAILFGVVTEI